MAYAIIATKPGGTDVLRRVDIDLPVPSASDVLIRQTAVGVNFIDVYFRTGLYPWPAEKDLIVGSEGAGIVEAVGPQVSGFSIGDRVAYTVAHGGYATHRLVPAASLVPLPDEISDQQAAALMLKGLTAYYLLHDSYPVQAGDVVLFHAAAGGVGSLAGQWLKSKGVRAIGTAGGAGKCERAMANGFEQAIDYRSENFVERVMELTKDQGVDAVYDSVGKDTIMGSLECLKAFGTLVSFGQSSGLPDQFRIVHLAKGSFHLTRPVLFHFTRDRGWLERSSESLFNAVAKGAVRANVESRLPLSRAWEAHQNLENRKSTGSTILIP
jgi:NADPH2:quinone reductase